MRIKKQQLRIPASKDSGLFAGHFPFDAKLDQDVFHQAPTRERGLKKVRTHQGREPQPVGIHPVSESQTYENEASCDQSYPSFYNHKLLLSGFSSTAYQ